MKLEILLTIVGFFGTLGLTINAFFLRGIFSDLNEVKIRLAEMMARSEARSEKLLFLEKKSMQHDNAIQELNQRVNLLEAE